MNPNKALWEKGDFTRIAESRRESGTAFVDGLGITKGLRTPYDDIMRQLRNIAKVDVDYQKNTARKVVEFPPGSSWVLFTDNVLHGALKGQYAFEQTFWLDVTAMREPERSLLRVLERLSARPLV